MKSVLCTALLLGCLMACNQVAETGAGTQVDSTPVSPASAAIPETRTHINPKPVAVYQKTVPDELNKWVFQVEVYETARTLDYLVRMQYKELRISDQFRLPPLAKMPEINIKPGQAPFSCIIGFVDQQQVFRPYKEVVVKHEQLRFKTVATYSVSKKKVSSE
ncbi:MAG: hypothetical protein GXC72_10055 [Chitinophagaceae bacterium]|nr:hypothetical protein [Chitinophagaceae bacterium]